MSSVVRIEYVDLSTELVPNEVIVTGDSLDIVTRKDQRSLIGVEAGDDGVSILSSPLNDTIVGGEGDDSINGSAGNDVLDGLAGVDTVVGGSGNDTITGGPGSDSLVGGDGNDVLNITSGDSVRTGTGKDVIAFDLDAEFDPKNLPKITDFEPGEDQIVILGGDDSGDDIAYDLESKTLIVEGQGAVEVDGDFILTASDIDFDGSDRDVSLVDSSETKVYEFFNSSNDLYFYTVDENEKAFIEDNLDNYELREGEGFNSVDPISGSDVEEVHRFFNTETGAHFYTTNEVERDSILENFEQYSYEDVKFYGYSSDAEGDDLPEDAMPVYRFFDPMEGTHIFTHSQTEMTEMSSNDMFNDEGIAFYAMPADTMS